MNHKKSIITTLLCFALTIFIWASFADDTTITQMQGKTLSIAQTQEQSNQKGSGKTIEKKLSKESDGGRCSSNGMHGHMMMKHAHSYPHMIVSHADALQLSDEQLGKIVRLHMQGTIEHKKIKEKIYKNYLAFQKAKMQPGTEDETLRKLGKEYADAFSEMVEYHIKERKAVHNILTPEQMNKLKTMEIRQDMHGSDHSNGGIKQI
ncbi:Spy/CpxP family protein refolding chaperone [Nitrosomonas sp. Nm33]|uniref:Spy/CpxP family protein refolding chaperone n=1 Tax=Nitrosomonas sp. Nm33 TaxID=133724 RepID=UPI00089734C5|nr:Spy/CpxP family protein refolding chaperone [Nitrosomonas sp. Nm33]SDY85150.1 LTXXQ motif family protein [Nitrosomonas sp. Nm33]